MQNTDNIVFLHPPVHPKPSERLKAPAPVTARIWHVLSDHGRAATPFNMAELLFQKGLAHACAAATPLARAFGPARMMRSFPTIDLWGKGERDTLTSMDADYIRGFCHGLRKQGLIPAVRHPYKRNPDAPRIRIWVAQDPAEFAALLFYLLRGKGNFIG